MANVNGVYNQLVSPQSIQTASANTTVAKANLAIANTTAAVLLVPAATNPAGGLVRKVTVKPLDTCTLTVQYLFRSPDNGTTLYFIADVATSAYTKNATTATPITDFGYTQSAPLYLEAGDSLWCASAVGLPAGFIWDAQYEVYTAAS